MCVGNGVVPGAFGIYVPRCIVCGGSSAGTPAALRALKAAVFDAAKMGLAESVEEFPISSLLAYWKSTS
jgi:hypothetical protein